MHYGISRPRLYDLNTALSSLIYLHEGVIDCNDENITSVFEIPVVDVARNMRV